MALVLAVLAGCSRSTSPGQKSASQSGAPDAAAPRAQPAEQTPEHAVQAALDAISRHRPDELWSGLPGSYQSDVQSLVRDFARRMDRDVWNRLFASLSRAARLLNARRELFISYPLLAESEWIDADELTAHWDEIVGWLDTLIASDLADLDQLEKIDVAEFLATTGRTSMQRLSTFSVNKFDGARAELVEFDGDTAVVRIVFAGGAEGEIVPDLSPADYEFVRIEGRWIPKALADAWPAQIASLRSYVESLTPEVMEFQKEGLLAMLDSVDRVIENLEQAETDEEFHAILAGQVVLPLQAAVQLFQLAPTADPTDASPPSTEPKPDSSGEGTMVTVVWAAEPKQQAVGRYTVRLMDLTDDPAAAIATLATTDDGLPSTELSPVRDVEAFARRIDFGQVIDVDPTARRIVVQVSE